MSIVVVLAAALASCSRSTSPAITTQSGLSEEGDVVLPVICIPQDRIAWVWSTSTAIVLEFYLGPLAPEVCEIQSNFAHFDCCEQPVTCTQAGNITSTQQSLAANGFGSVLVAALTFAQVQDEIDDGRPVMPVITDSFPGHIVVIYGYNEEREELFLCDPFFGDFIIPYDTTFTYTPVGSLNWGTTLIRID